MQEFQGRIAVICQGCQEFKTAHKWKAVSIVYKIRSIQLEFVTDGLILYSSSTNCVVLHHKNDAGRQPSSVYFYSVGGWEFKFEVNQTYLGNCYNAVLDQSGDYVYASTYKVHCACDGI